MTSKAGHTFTAGPWRAKGRTIMNADGVKIATATVHSGGKNFKPDEVAEANAALIAEAGTILHETGLTPRQLAERCEKLEGALRELQPALLADHGCKGGLSETTRKRAYAIVSAALSKATAGGAV